MSSVISLSLLAIRHPKASREVGLLLKAIYPIMTDEKETRDTKRKVLCTMAEELSEKTFKLKPVAEVIMTIINMKEEVCKEYDNTEAQVNGILGWLPRMSYHRALLLEEVKKHRQECELPI